MKDIERALEKSSDLIEYRYSLPTFVEKELIPANSYGIDELSDHQISLLDNLSDLSNNRIIISAARNTGKTIMLAALAVWSVAVLPKFLDQPYEVVVLGGSMKQSQQLYKYTKGWFEESTFLKGLLEDEPRKTHTDLVNGSKIAALTASEKQVRGEHPHMIILDEAAEIDDELVDAAIPMVASKTPNRIVMSSTPHHYHSKFVDMWNDSKRGENLYDNYHWTMDDCDWIGESFKEEVKKQFDDATYKVEIEGIPHQMEGSVFSVDDIKECVKNSVESDPEAPKILGIDYGMTHPSVITLIQIKDGTYEVLKTWEYKQTRFSEIREKVGQIFTSYNVQMIYADDSHKGENQRLQENGLTTQPVSFSGGAKPTLVSNLRNIVENHNLVIPYNERKLIDQLSRYSYKTTKTGKTRFADTKDDYVDSLILATRYNAIQKASGYFFDVV